MSDSKVQCCAMTVATKKEESRQCKKNAVNGGTMCAIHLKKNAADVESTDPTSASETTEGGAPEAPKTPTKPKKEPKTPGAPGRKKKSTQEEVPAMVLPTGGGAEPDANAFAETPVKKGRGRPKKAPGAPKKSKQDDVPSEGEGGSEENEA